MENFRGRHLTKLWGDARGAPQDSGRGSRRRRQKYLATIQKYILTPYRGHNYTLCS